jgi:hypothetical protein
MNDPERQLLTRLSKIEDFFRSVLYDDSLDDWYLALDFGEFLVRIEPREAMGYALLARAHRHVGNLECARVELEKCRALTRNPSEVELFLSFLAEEDRLLSRTSESGTDK